MKGRLFYIVNILLAAILLLSCSKTDVLKEPQAYKLAVPSNFPQPESSSTNPLTIDGIALGRRLFYDVRLSGNNQISCASCHKQDLAFSDGVALSTTGVSGTTLLRHSPTLINLAWSNNGLFWDGGSTNLESQAFGPLSAHDEMDQNLYELIDELRADPTYIRQFQQAFQQDISSPNIVKALAQFQRTIVSANSRYDKYVRKEDGGWLSDVEKNGLTLVKQKCQGCHSSDLFTDNNYHNNGLDATFNEVDHEGIYLGRYRVSYQLADVGAYKTPTLRNIMLTAPYMHDGRFANIEAVLQHYAQGVKVSPSLAKGMYQLPNGAAGIALSQTDIQAIIAFLKTLTDEDFIHRKDLTAP